MVIRSDRCVRLDFDKTLQVPYFWLSRFASVFLLIARDKSVAALCASRRIARLNLL